MLSLPVENPSCSWTWPLLKHQPTCSSLDTNKTDTCMAASLLVIFHQSSGQKQDMASVVSLVSVGSSQLLGCQIMARQDVLSFAFPCCSDCRRLRLNQAAEITDSSCQSESHPAHSSSGTGLPKL